MLRLVWVTVRRFLRVYAFNNYLLSYQHCFPFGIAVSMASPQGARRVELSRLATDDKGIFECVGYGV